ncbi:MAG: pantetheine-phosphate adenylyltransferase [Candidatus Heimdallarchaeota archaeon]
MIGLRDEAQRCFKLCLYGGTFDRLHVAHRVLLEVALTLAKQVAIGVTSDEMVQGKMAAEKIQPFKERVKQLKEYLANGNFQGRFQIAQLTKPEGISEELADADAMIVSEETHPMLDKINAVRSSRGLTPLVKIFVPYILTNSGRPYRSTDLRLEEE